MPALAAFSGRLTEGPATLLAFLEPLQAAGILAGKIIVYAFNGASVDTGDQTAAARAGQARTLMANFAAATAFFDPELMGIGLDQIDAWIAETPALADLIGLDVTLAIADTLYASSGNPYFKAPLLRRMVAVGQLGRKTGRGFYDYRRLVT